jgi:hypothetical protein
LQCLREAEEQSIPSNLVAETMAKERLK